MGAEGCFLVATESFDAACFVQSDETCIPASGDGCGVPANCTFKMTIVQTTQPSKKPIVSAIRLWLRLLLLDKAPCRIRAIIGDSFILVFDTIPLVLRQLI
jgi:hypothetical protein